MITTYPPISNIAFIKNFEGKEITNKCNKPST